jgi:ribosomal protein S18 acetylase RimI-like enzyme
MGEKKNVRIVSPKFTDIEGITNVFYKTWLDTYPNEKAGVTREDVNDLYKNAFKKKHLVKKWEWIHTLDHGIFLIAKSGRKVIGVICLLVAPDKNQLKALYVLPEYQRRGIGSMLWEKAKIFLDHSKNTVIVQAAAYNKKAISFYKKLGFKDNKRRWKNEGFRMRSGAIIEEMEMEMRIEYKNVN